METKNKACCVFGHRSITQKEELKKRLTQTLEKLITSEQIDTFYVGSKGDFNSLCCEALSEQKQKYPHIQRIYVRAEYEYISDDYERYLLKSCEKTYFPERVKNAGNAVYVERNYEMIDNSDLCIVYYEDGHLPPRRKNSRNDLFDYQPKSGTAIAYQYALNKKKTIINLAK